MEQNINVLWIMPIEKTYMYTQGGGRAMGGSISRQSERNLGYRSGTENPKLAIHTLIYGRWTNSVFIQEEVGFDLT